jgi:hypothetical protein
MGYPHLMGKTRTIRAAGVIQRLFPFLAHVVVLRHRTITVAIEGRADQERSVSRCRAVHPYRQRAIGTIPYARRRAIRRFVLVRWDALREPPLIARKRAIYPHTHNERLLAEV